MLSKTTLKLKSQKPWAFNPCWLFDDDTEKPREVLVMKKYYLCNRLQKVREDRMGEKKLG